MWSSIVKKIQGKLTGKQKPEKWQEEIITATSPFTMTSELNILALTKAVKHIVENNIEGAIVECGVWKGGSMMAAAMSLIHLEDRQRQIYLYDTFEHFSEPREEDISYKGEKGAEVLMEQAAGKEHWLAPSLDEVKDNMGQTSYPPANLHFIKGEVEKTIPATMPGKIALLRLDTDWYASTKHELTWLYPLLSKGGVLIIDDYGYWAGCKKAVDEYFENEKIKPGLIPIDFSARMIYKS